MDDWREKIYLHSPNTLQTCFLNLYSLWLKQKRFGRKLEALLRWLEESQYWSSADLRSYQEERLKTIIAHAYETTPFYRESMDAKRLKPKDIRTLADLPKMPLCTKEDVKKAPAKFCSFKFKESALLRGHTSGTTGSPLQVFWDRGMVLMNNAADWRQKAWAGFRIGDPHALFLGRVMVPIHQRKPPFWRMNYVLNQLWFSAFHMSEENLIRYVERLQKFGPKFIEGYPSTLYILARYLNRRALRIPLKAVFTSSETLFPHQKEEIEGVFDCAVYDFYGLAERVVFASECPRHGMHLNSEYGITEFVDETGVPVSLGTKGRMVGTSLHNLGMPLVRYLTDDISLLKNESCSCGRNLPLMEKVTTKQEDIIMTPDGRWISPSVLTHPFKPIVNIVESQVIQEELDRLVIRIVKGPSYCDEDSSRLRQSLAERIGKSVRIELDFVDQLPREKSGKFRWVISKVSSQCERIKKEAAEKARLPGFNQKCP